MTRQSNWPALMRRLRQEIGVVLRLSPLVMAALVLGTLLWRGSAETASGMFQSSPVELPTATSESTVLPSVSPEPSPSVTDTATPAGIETPVVTLEPSLTPQPTEPPATDTPLPTEMLATETPAPTDALIPAEEAETETPIGERYGEGGSDLVFDWGMLFDALALFLSYAWLVCGILLFILVPTFFIVRWLRRRRGEQVEE